MRHSAFVNVLFALALVLSAAGSGCGGGVAVDDPQLDPGGGLDGRMPPRDVGATADPGADDAGANDAGTNDAGTNNAAEPSPFASIALRAGGLGGRGSGDGIGDVVRFNLPGGAAADATGNIFVADSTSFTIRKISASGAVSTLARTAEHWTEGAGPPGGVAVDGAGNVFVLHNCTVQKVTVSGVVSTFAGRAGTSGSADGAGPAARFGCAGGIVADAMGNVYVADAHNAVVRKITPAGVVTTLAGSEPGAGPPADGSGAAARFTAPRSIAIDGSGTLFVADGYTIRKVTALGEVTTYAGSLVAPASSADGVGVDARFYWPGPIAVDGAGNVYVADSAPDLAHPGPLQPGPYVIRRIAPGGVVTTIAGSVGARGSANGTGAAARFGLITGVAVDGAGNLVVTDRAAAVLRTCTPAGVVTTFVGNEEKAGSADGVGAAARFSRPQATAVDGAGNAFVADTNNHTIRKVTPDGVVTTLAGKAGEMGSADGAGPDARFASPRGIAVAGDGTVYVSDLVNQTIRKITPAGVVSTLAGVAGSNGSTDGPGPMARFGFPEGLALDVSGNIFVADSLNRNIRKITPAGVVTTFAGRPFAGYDAPTNVDGPAAAAAFAYPQGVAVDASGNVFVADEGNDTIRKITSAGVVTTIAGAPGVRGSADGAGPDARFDGPFSIVVDAAGHLFVADYNSAIRMITPGGFVTSVVGVAGQRTVETGPLPRRLGLGSGGGVIALGPKGLVVIEENAVLDIFR